MNGAEYIVEFLIKKDVDTIFGYPGGSVIFLYDVLGRYPIKHILTRHEQGAVHAADGYARVTGKPGVCFATSGPGATNLVTGIANAYLDSVPLIAITGQVGLASIGRDAFQEADITGITMPVTKHSYMVKNIDDLPAVLEEAWQVANTGRKGPVLIDVPKDIFVAEVKMPEHINRLSTRKVAQKNGMEEQLEKVLIALEEAKRPLLFVGGGINSSDASAELAALVEYTELPVVSSLMGKGTFNEKHPHALGMVGMHGHPVANLALTSCDLVLSIGVRFSDRITGNPQGFLPDARIIHVDIDAAELQKNVSAYVPIVCDAKKFIRALLEGIITREMSLKREEWLLQIKQWKETYPLVYEREGLLKPQHVIEEAAAAAGKNVVLVTDVGQHQMFAAQYFPLTRPRSFVTSGGLGTMGFGLPAAIGASIGKTEDAIVLITGDGGLQMTVQELATIRENNLPIKIFLLNNSCLGMVRQWQEMFFKKHYVQTIFKMNPDFVNLAEAYGIKALRCKDPEDLEKVATQVFEIDGPVLVECIVSQEENVLPIVPAGKKPNEMLGRWHGEAHVSRIS